MRGSFSCWDRSMVRRLSNLESSTVLLLLLCWSSGTYPIFYSLFTASCPKITCWKNSVALSQYSHGSYHFLSTSFFLHLIFKSTFTLPQNLVAFCRPVQKHFLSTSLSKICTFFCLNVLNVLLLYLTCNYFTFCLNKSNVRTNQGTTKVYFIQTEVK